MGGSANPSWVQQGSLLLLYRCVLKPNQITHTSAWNGKKRSLDGSRISTERFPKHMRAEFLERAPDLWGSHTGQKTRRGLSSQQHVAVCKAGLWHTVAHCAVWNMSWLEVIPCQHPVSPWRSKALSVCCGLLSPRAGPSLLTWHGVWAWLDFQKGSVSNGLIQNDSFQSSIISSHCSNPVLRQHGWQQGSIYVTAVSVWDALITAASLINSNWKQLTLRKTKPIRDPLTKEDECALRANVRGEGTHF